MRQRAKTPSESSTTVAKIMMPMDANVSGNVFGGTILRLIDGVASIVAFKHARSNVVTASFRFSKTKDFKGKFIGVETDFLVVKFEETPMGLGQGSQVSVVE